MIFSEPRGRKMRSVWGTTPIINIRNNAKAESLLGIEAETLVFSSYHITKGFTHDFSVFCRFKPLRFLWSCLIFPWALLRYDIFHYFFDRGILPSWNRSGIPEIELKILKALRKKVFVYTYGGDVRTRKTTEALGKYNCCMHCPAVGKACVCDEDKHLKNYERVRRYATEIFSMGDMTEYTPGSDNGLFFWPIDIAQVPFFGAGRQKPGPVKIVHAPNHRHFKGTDYLLRTVDKLKAEGLNLELVLVEKMPNEKALEIYKQADIIACQFIIGWHGFTAIEAMALGKPVICYIRKPEYLLAAEECPIVSANPDELEAAIRDLAANPEKRSLLGKQGRAYVEKNYSLEAFAERLEKIYVKHGILAMKEREMAAG